MPSKAGRRLTSFDVATPTEPSPHLPKHDDPGSLGDVAEYADEIDQ